MDRYSLKHQAEDDTDFEKGRIRALRDERLLIQKKTFTKWVNSFLAKTKIEINDLFVDLSDGRSLMKLLEIISGDKLGKPNAGKMRVHKIENVNKCLAFLHTKVRLESIGAEDIVDGNPRLTLGLIWTIILRFQIQEIEINVDEQHEDSEKKQAKDALLLWCQRMTRGYKNVDVKDFTGSWRDGLAFNALLHNQRSDVVDFGQLQPANHTYNLGLAFETADRCFGISKLLDPEDVDVARPDEKSILTYVASYYHTFSKLNEGFRSGKKISNIISKIKRIEDQQHEYEVDSKALLEWIASKTKQMKKRSFANSLDGVQNDVRLFKMYMTREKPPKCQEKVNLEVNFFEIETKLKELRQHPYVPPDGHRLSDIDQAWKALEVEEHLLESALRTEVMRLEKLEQYAAKFSQKVALRNSYLDEMIQVLSDPRYGSNVSNVEASLKKHEAISADIISRENRFQDIGKMMAHLNRENFHGKNQTNKIGEDILAKWQHLLGLLDSHQQKLERDSDMLSHLRDLETVHATVQSLQKSFNSEEFQKAANIDGSMQKLNLYDLEINAIADSIRKFRAQGKQFTSRGASSELSKSVSENFRRLEEDFEKLVNAGKTTRQKFEDKQCVQQTRNDLDEVQNWVQEKLALCSTKTSVKDLLALSVQQEKHRTFQTEMKNWEKRYDNVKESMKRLQSLLSGEVVSFREKVETIDKQWKELCELSNDKANHLVALTAKLNLNYDLNEAESWVKDITSLVASGDYGVDEVTATALLNRHREVCDQIVSFKKDLGKLHLTKDLPKSTMKRRLVEQRPVAQVRALYSYNKHGINVVKGELMFLIEKTNKDWWNVRTTNGEDGFAPATYVKEIEPKIVHVEVDKDVEHFETAEDMSGEALQVRLENLGSAYKNIEKKASKRENNLLNAIKIFNFKSQCERCKYWLGERQRDLLSIKSTNENSLKVDEICKSILKYEITVVDLRRQANELSMAIPSEKDQINAAVSEVEKLWASLDSTRKTSERKISTKMQLEKFKKTCNDTIDWITEKLDYVDSLDSMFTINALDNMMRRHKALEREMVPINEKVEEVKSNYKIVTKLFPDEVKTVSPRVEKMALLHNELISKLNSKGANILMLGNEKLFSKMTKDLSDWLQTKKTQMDQVFSKDISKADLSRPLLIEIKDELKQKEDDLREIEEIAKSLLQNGSNKDVGKTLEDLQKNHKDFLDVLQAQSNFIDNVDKYKSFNQEADGIDSHISSCRRLLPEFVKQPTNDELDVLTKRQDLLAAMISGYEKKVTTFLKSSEKLNPKEHLRYEESVNRREAIINSWEKLSKDFNQCTSKIQDYKTMLDLSSTIENMQQFIAEKGKLTQDRTFRDAAHLRSKLKKHEALDSEVKAIGSEMRLVKMRVDKIQEDRHPDYEIIAEKYNNLESSWKRLLDMIGDKYNFLRESLNGVDISNNTEVINSKVSAIASDLTTVVEIQDVKHCNQLIAKHKGLHNTFKILEQKLNSLETDADDIVVDGKKKEGILQGVHNCRESLESLKPLFEERMNYLNESIKFHQLMSELNAELQWLQEKDRLIGSGWPESAGLMQIRSLMKRHKSLEEEISNHLPVVQELISKASKCKDSQKNNSELNSACQQLINGEKMLKQKLVSRSSELEMGLKTFSLLEEINDIESWIQVKLSLLESQSTTGKDEDTIVLYLKKHNAFELELNSYSGIVNETRKSAQALCQSGHHLAELVRHKDELLTQQFSMLQRLSRNWLNSLMSQLQLHEFLRECSEVRHWIKEKIVAASSPDLGQDFEHLEILLSKYKTLRKDVFNGKEKVDDCMNLAQRLKTPENSDINSMVQNYRDDCKAEWEHLVQAVEFRGKKLEAAGEIHKFNRDVSEALLRIAEKESSLGNETGKDIKSIQRLLRFQDVFENDLTALESQLDSLAKDSLSLQKLYPGQNAEHIAEQLAHVDERWSCLQEKSKQHRQLLQANLEFQTVLLSCQDLLTWCSHLKIMLLSEEKVSSVAEVQMLKSEHENVKGEIEMKEASFKDLAQRIERMNEWNNPFKEDTTSKWDQVIEKRNDLHMAWQEKKVYLDQLLDLHCFMRDTKQIMAFYSAQERMNNRTVNTDSLEAIEDELKVFETNLVKMKNFDDKTRTLKNMAKKLIDQNHFDSKFIKKRVAEIIEYKDKVLKDYLSRETYLNHCKTSLEFHRDVTEVEGWMKGKMENFSKAAKEYEQGSLSDKIRFLQKYTVFENEVRKHEMTVEDIVKKGNFLINSKHKIEETKLKVDSLKTLWKALKNMSDQIRRDLEDALDMFNLETEIDSIDGMIREKEYMSNVSDIGRDLEHCKELQLKLSEVNTNMTINQKVDKAENLVKKVKSSKNMAEDVDKANLRLENAVLRWNSIQDAVNAYKKALDRAMLAHQLISDMRDLVDIIAEKKNLINFDAKTLDQTGAEKAIQKCQTTGDFIRSLEDRILNFGTQTHQIVRELHPLSDEARDTHQTLVEAWTSCLKLNDEQLENIVQQENDIKTIKLMADLRNKLTTMISEIEGIRYPESDVESIDAALAEHEDRKAAIQIQKDILMSLEAGLPKSVKTSDSDSSSDEESSVVDGQPDARLLSDWTQLRKLMNKAESEWDQSKRKLIECKQFQAFYLKVLEMSAWLENKKAFLEASGLCESYTYTDIEGAIRQQQDFDRSLTQEQKSFKGLQNEADKMIRDGHFKKSSIEKNINELDQKIEVLREKNSTRVEELQASKKCYLLIRKMNELRSWMKEKLHVALDESYLELTNIHSKLQRHSVFESEIISNNERFIQIDREVELTCNAPSVPSTSKKEVHQQLEDLKAEWKHLNETMKLKKVRLEQAKKAVEFMNSIDEVNTWMAEAEETLRGDDLGKDVESTTALIKKIASVESDLYQQESKLTQLRETCNGFEKDNHFAQLMLEKNVKSSMNQLDNLQQKSIELKESLEDSLVYHELVKDVHDAILWEKEKTALVSSTDFGNSLVEVQAMMKRHQLLESDIANHDSVVDTLTSKGEQLIKSNHPQSKEISEIFVELQARRNQLKDTSSIRKLRLDDALESQQFYIQCLELMSWISEKNYLVSQKIHIDNDFMHTLLKRIDELELELTTHSRQVQLLHDQAEAFISRGHFEKDMIKKQAHEIVEAFKKLETMVKSQKGQLLIKQKVYQYIRDKEEMVDLINCQLTIAGSEDYGKDLYDVERLIHNFNIFLENLNQHEEKLSKLNSLSNELLNDVCDYDVEGNTKEVNGMWEDLSELASARKEALNGAKKVHAFDKKIDETLEWILEKEALLSVEINCQDAETIEDLKHRQVGLKQDVKAIDDQIVTINENADSLTSFYPDAMAHIMAKRRELLRAIEKLGLKVKERDQQLEQNEQLLDYHSAFRELLSWASEFLARMTSPELNDNLQEAVSLHGRHKQLHDEMKQRLDIEFVTLIQKGQKMVDDNHLMKEDVIEKIQTLTNKSNTLRDIWSLRNRIYEQHMDYLRWLKAIHELESWMQQKEEEVLSPEYGSSLDDLSNLMIRQLEMEEALQNKESKVTDIIRITLIESEFQALKVKEEEARREDEKRLEADRLDAVKKKEMERQRREKRREDERRRTQEIVLPPDHTFKELMAPENDTSIPRFNTRRSIRQPAKSWKYDPSNLPPVTKEDFLERKQETMSGRRAALRSWKSYYTVLCGQILCFFKDAHDFKESKAASPPLLIHKAIVEKATDYTKRKHVIRLVTHDTSEYLFDAATKENCETWMEILFKSANSDPGESVRQSIVNNDHVGQSAYPVNLPTSFKKSATLEPVYANLPAREPESDTISEVDSREKQRGMLSKLRNFNKKSKVAN